MNEINFMSDKDLMRAGRYQEALGNNFNPKPYYILFFKNGMQEEPESIDGEFETHEEALAKCDELGITQFIIGNDNADWL